MALHVYFHMCMYTHDEDSYLWKEKDSLTNPLSHLHTPGQALWQPCKTWGQEVSDTD